MLNTETTTGNKTDKTPSHGAYCLVSNWTQHITKSFHFS